MTIGLESRVNNRINNLMKDYVEERNNKKDITTEEKEFEQSKNELSFRPNIS